jgi:MFS family permease
MHWPRPLRCLENRNLRLFFGGQAVSLVGTWMQSVAQGWLVWRLTQSSQMLGAIAFLAQTPVLLFGAWAGSLADRLPRRSMVLATQGNAVVQALLLATLTLGGWVRPWMLLLLAFMLGLTYAFEIPARQALLGEIAGPDMPNALALNSSIVNGARIVGPALAGVIVAAVGEGWAFALNALSFLGTIRALLVMQVPPHRPAPRPTRTHLAEGLAWAWHTPMVRALLALLAASSIFGMSYVALLPMLSARVLGGGPGLFGLLQSCAGAGALSGGVLLMMRSGLAGLERRAALGAAALAGGLFVVALSRTPLLSAGALVVAGFGYVTQTAGTMTLLQDLSPPQMRGRMMGLFSTIFVGLSPFGALAGGFAAARYGVPRTFLAGSTVVFCASIVFQVGLPRLRRDPIAAAGGEDGAGR